ncbi:MAG TPA: TlpA family protein disulfide reductase, partial [Firmicutes bacterium]|nr:TlpA family protein disulfide reductase [Bacillota bacterium]
MKKLIILPLVIAGILFSACEEKTSGSKKAPYFSLKTPDGKVLKLSDYKGKVVILNFFATWCAPCRYEIPDFVEFYNKNKGKIEIIGIAVNSPVSQVKNMIKKYKIRYPVVI